MLGKEHRVGVGGGWKRGRSSGACCDGLGVAFAGHW